MLCDCALNLSAIWLPSTQIWGPLGSCFSILLRLIIIVSLKWTLQSHMRDETIKLPCVAFFSALCELICLQSPRLSSAQAGHSTNSTLKMWKKNAAVQSAGNAYSV